MSVLKKNGELKKVRYGNWVIGKRNRQLGMALIFLVLVGYQCTVQPARDSITPAMTIRVGIVQYQQRIVFRALDDIVVQFQDGSLQQVGKSGDTFVASAAQAKPAKMAIKLLVDSFESKEQAEQEATRLSQLNIPAVVRSQQRLSLHSGQLVRGIKQLVFLEPSFATSAEAQKYQETLPTSVKTRIRTFMEQLPEGVVELQNQRTAQTIRTAGYLQITDGQIALDVKSGAGFHYENTSSRTFRATLNIVIDDKAALTLVNEIPFEKYISSVIASEMNSEFPLEALKAQAVTARSFTVSKIETQHPTAPFDVCDDVHCQVYSGVTRVSKRTDSAARETAGYVLMSGNDICETYYHSVCGGHTENNDNIWEGNPRSYLRGVLDVPPSQASIPNDFLQNETNIARWIYDKPKVICNVQSDSSNVPSFLNYAKKYFRWNVVINQADIRANVRKNTGQDVGDIMSITALERGLSGRINRLRIMGTKGSVVVEKDLPIRKALTATPLYSSCFIVMSDSRGGSVPGQFEIDGAGWGHGVGMCQTGAAMMALQDRPWQEILSHYYTGATLRKIY
jgi:stage II sporulation protein D